MTLGMPIFLYECQAILDGRQKYKWGNPPSKARSQKVERRHFGFYVVKSYNCILNISDIIWCSYFRNYFWFNYYILFYI